MSLFTAEQHILVTGGSSGIGRAIALRLCSEGATVIAQGRDESRLNALRAEAADSERMLTVVHDFLTDTAGTSAWFDTLCAQFGQFSGLVCAAGITWNSPLSFYPLEKAHAIFDLCCHAPLILGGVFCRKRFTHDSGRAIVYIAAAAATHPNPGQGIYGAAKAALVSGAKCLALEAAPRVRVNCLSPGLVQSPMMDATVQQLGSSFLEREKPRYPLGFGMPEDVANCAVFLLSQQAQWITGQNIFLGIR